jgi:predicted dehydrogenase
MDEVRMGIVGLGHRACKGWIPLLQKIPGFKIVALCDPVGSSREEARGLVSGDVRMYRDYGDLLADDDVDAVGLTVRSEAQGALAAEGLRAGKHVHAEVPAAFSLEDCWDIVLAAEETGLVYAIAEQSRYLGFVEAWRDLVAAGSLGHITLCEGQYFHYYMPPVAFRDPVSGRFYGPDEVGEHPEAEATWSQRMQPIHYLPHELSPMLKVLGDRVVEVVAMSTAEQSYVDPVIKQANMQVALMKTAKDTILRVAASFSQPHPEGEWHWYQLCGTAGRVEWRRAPWDQPKVWFAGAAEAELAPADWTVERKDAPDAARGSGHSDADYYPHAAFRDAVLYGKPHELDVYAAMETAAPAIVAAMSIAAGSTPLTVPDFRPSPSRPAGTPPTTNAI